MRLRSVATFGFGLFCAAAAHAQNTFRTEPDGNGASASSEPEFLFQVWVDEDIIVARSEELGAASLPFIDASTGAPTAQWIRMPDGSAGRAVGIRIPSVTTSDADGTSFPGRTRTMEIVVARDTKRTETTLGRVRLVLALSWGICSLLCAGILSWVVRRGLHPLTDLCRQIEKVDEERLDRRFQLENSPVELSVVMDELNQMVGRLRRAFDREQAFAADAAHELRTPIAGLQMSLEVALSRTRESEEYRETARQCLEITTEMQRVVEALMELANPASALTTHDADEVVPLDELVDECARPFLADAERRRVTLTTDIAGDMRIERNAHYLRRVIGNLIENATHYADEGSEIVVTGRHYRIGAAGESGEAGGVELAVENEAQGAPADLAEHAFDAFWRADTSRSQVGRHAGLGLSLCKRIVEELCGTIDIKVTGGRFIATLRVPDGRGSGGERMR